MLIYLTHIAEIRVHDKIVSLKVLDIDDCGQNPDKMYKILNKLIHEVDKIYQKSKKRNEIILLFDLRRASNTSMSLMWPLLGWLRETKPFLSEVLDFTYVEGPTGIWKTILQSLQMFISTARPVLIDECPPELLELVDS